MFCILISCAGNRDKETWWVWIILNFFFLSTQSHTIIRHGKENPAIYVNLDEIKNNKSIKTKKYKKKKLKRRKNTTSSFFKDYSYKLFK